MLYLVEFSLKNNILMCILLIGILSTATYAASPACGCVAAPTSQCRTSSGELARKNDFYQNSAPYDSFFTMLQQESLQKVEELQKDPIFQETVKTLQNNAPQSQYTESNSSPETQATLFDANLNKTILYIFVSFSMGEKALLNLAHEAKQFGATLVLRGFHGGSYAKTAQALQKIILKTGQGVIVDPEVYSLFDITAVPTFVLANSFPFQSQERIQTPIHDKLQGHVSVYYALETFAKKGDLKTEAQGLLTERTLSKGVSK